MAAAELRQRAPITIVAEMRDRQSGQESCRVPVLFGLQGVPEQDLLDEKLFCCVGKWIGQPAYEQLVGPRNLRTTQESHG